MPDGSQISEKDLADLLSIRGDLSKVSDDVKNLGTDVIAKVTAGQQVSAELTTRVDEALSGQATLRTRMDEMDQKLVRRAAGLDNPARGQTPGDIFLADERVQKFMAERSRGRVRVDMATITTGNVGATRDVLVPVDRQQAIVGIPDRRLTVRDLLTPGRTSSNAIQYVQETGFTNNAAIVSEGTTKPESSVTFELVTVPVSTIAHFMVASKQILDDAPALQSHIDGRLRYGVAYAEEAQLLLGDGVGANLHGIIPQATAYSAAFTPTSPQAIDTIRLAILQSEIALFPATGIVLNQTDWARIELTKDSQGRYIFANVQSVATPTLWARPVVATPAMTIDKFLVGAFRLGAQIFDREDANVEISTEDSDNFRKNLITLRGEERLALAVYRPQCFIYGDFGNVT